MHGDAMKRAVLADERAAVDADDLASGKRPGQTLKSQRVFRRRVCRHENSAIEDQKVGVGRRQAMAVLGIVDGIGHGQRDQRVGMTVNSAEGAQLLLHAPQRIVMFVRRIVALHVGDRTAVAETRQRVDMAVGIVAGQIAVTQPEDAVETERLLEERLKLRL